MGGTGCELQALPLPKGGAWAQCQGPFRATGHANRVNRGGHMISLKNKISFIHTPCSLVEVFCFFFLLLYFKSDRFVGQAELGLGANLEGEDPGGRRPFLLPIGQGRVLDESLLETPEKCLPCSGLQSRLWLQPSGPSLSK